MEKYKKVVRSSVPSEHSGIFLDLQLNGCEGMSCQSVQNTVVPHTASIGTASDATPSINNCTISPASKTNGFAAAVGVPHPMECVQEPLLFSSGDLPLAPLHHTPGQHHHRPAIQLNGSSQAVGSNTGSISIGVDMDTEREPPKAADKPAAFPCANCGKCYGSPRNLQRHVCKATKNSPKIVVENATLLNNDSPKLGDGWASMDSPGSISPLSSTNTATVNKCERCERILCSQRSLKRHRVTCKVGETTIKHVNSEASTPGP
uniref:C2H2-type domain-containing protein n=1 Tax=Ditylenchus dipsaci TaxID=166011 RepID=A0A915CS25_9BILA